MTNDQAQALLTALCGIIAPILVSLAKQHHWSDATKAMVALLICAVLGGAAAAATGQFDWQNVLASVAGVFTIATTLYKTVFEKTLVNQNLEDVGSRP